MTPSERPPPLASVSQPRPAWVLVRSVPQVFKEDKYLKEAAECAEVIWHRGLLRKGYGICHGAAGNGYAFLSLYKLTRETKYLYRACKVRTPPLPVQKVLEVLVAQLSPRLWSCPPPVCRLVFGLRDPRLPHPRQTLLSL